MLEESSGKGKTVVMLWNVWSIMNELKLQNFLDVGVDVACVCETWFDAKNGKFSKVIRECGFKLHHAYRVGKRGGGVAIIYKKDLRVKEGEESTTKYQSFEYASITLTLSSKRNIDMVSIYRKQEVVFSIFYDEFSTYIEKNIFKRDALLIVGDFNVWVEHEDDKDAK